MAPTLTDLRGYADRDLDADLARWLPDEPRTQIPAETRSVNGLLDRLPPDGAAAPKRRVCDPSFDGWHRGCRIPSRHGE